jgi:hypothetical protein
MRWEEVADVARWRSNIYEVLRSCRNIENILFCQRHVCQWHFVLCAVGWSVREGAEKSLARPGSKHATATKLGIYSTYSPRSSVHFLAHCSNFCQQLKKNSEICPSNQVCATTITSVSEEKLRPFICLFGPGNRWHSDGARSGE